MWIWPQNSSVNGMALLNAAITANCHQVARVARERLADQRGQQSQALPPRCDAAERERQRRDFQHRDLGEVERAAPQHRQHEQQQPVDGRHRQRRGRAEGGHATGRSKSRRTLHDPAQHGHPFVRGPLARRYCGNAAVNVPPIKLRSRARQISGCGMTAIPSLSIASSTSSNWLAEAQSAEQAAEGGLLGALQSSSQGADDGSIKSFLATSQSNADAFASIAQAAPRPPASLLRATRRIPGPASGGGPAGGRGRV